MKRNIGKKALQRVKCLYFICFRCLTGSWVRRAFKKQTTRAHYQQLATESSPPDGLAPHGTSLMPSREQGKVCRRRGIAPKESPPDVNPKGVAAIIGSHEDEDKGLLVICEPISCPQCYDRYKCYLIKVTGTSFWDALLVAAPDESLSNRSHLPAVQECLQW